MSEADELKLPSGWTLTPVGDLLKFKNGLNKGKAYFGYGTPIVNYMDVFRHTGLRRADVHGLVDVTNAEKQAFSARKGDVLFTRTSETPEEVGISTVLLEDIEDAVFSGFVLRGRPVNARLTPEFAQYCFDSRFVRGQIVSSATYTTRALTNGRILSNVKLPLPDDPDEQQAIAAALSDADGVVAGLERVIAKKRLIKQGATQDLLTARRRLPGFSGEWEPVNLARESHLKARIGWQGLTTNEYRDSGEYHLITGTEIIDGRVDWRRCVFVDKWRFDQDRNIQLRNGDILLTKDGTIGKVAQVRDLPGPAALNSGVFVIRPKSAAYDATFLFHVLRSSVFDTFLAKLTAGSTIIHLYQKDLVTFEFLAPDIAEQKAIAETLDDMDAEIQTLESRLTKARAVKEGMMQNLLTGRVRLV